MIEKLLIDGTIRSCDYCGKITKMKIKLELQCTEEFFCSKKCKDLYCKQHDRGLKV